MKNYLLVFTAIFSTAYTHAFVDKDALTTTERAIKYSGNIAGAGVGAVGGAASGAVAGYVGGALAQPAVVGATVAGASVAHGELGGMVMAPAAAGLALVDPRNKDTREKDAQRGKVIGAGAGAVAGAAWGLNLRPGDRYLARRHGVSLSVELVSQFYNLNLSQYGMLLKAARKNLDQQTFRTKVGIIFNARFGQDWANKLVFAFDTYGENFQQLYKTSRSLLSVDEQDFIRMVEIGAAMANLYFKTRPNVARMLSNAIDMYSFLGLL